MAGTKNYTSGNPTNSPSVTVSSSPITHVEPFTGRIYEEEGVATGATSANTSNGDATYVTGNACQDCLNNINVGVAGAGESLYARRESNTFLFKGIKAEGAITVRTSGGSLIIGGSGALPSLDEILASHGTFTDEQKGKFLVINETGDGLDYADAPGGTGPTDVRFKDLSDVPLMTGQAGKVLTVNASGTGVDWKTPVVPVADTIVFNDKTPKLARYLDLNGFSLASMAAGYTTNVGYGASDVSGSVPVGTVTNVLVAADSTLIKGKAVGVVVGGQKPLYLPQSAPAVGQVLGFAGNANASGFGDATGPQLEWITPSAGGSTVTKFTALDDTPSGYTNQAGKYVRVKADSTGLEFVTPAVDWANIANKPAFFDGSYASLTGKPTIPTKLVDLSDVPSVAGNSGKVLGINGSGQFAWVSGGSAATTFASLTDIPSMTGQAAKVLTVNTNGTGVEWKAVAGSRFNTLSDAPASYTGQAGKVVRVNALETGVEFSVPTVDWSNVQNKETFVKKLVQLQDWPDMTGAGNKVLGLDATATTPKWISLPTGGGTGGSTTFLGLTDVPDSYSGAGKFVRTNSSNDGVEFVSLANVATSGAWIDISGRPTKVSDLDVPAYTSNGGKFLAVTAAGTGLEWKAVSAGATTLATLTDINFATAPTNGQVLTYNSTSSKWVAATPAAGGSSTFVSLTDGPGAFTGKAGQAVRVNAGATALEYYTPASGGTGATTLATLTDVNTTGAAANSILKYDTTTSKWIVGSLPAAGPTTLGALTDVSGAASTANGNILAYNTSTSKWTAVAHTHTLASLTDINVTTPATNGQYLKYDGTTSKWVPSNVVSALSGLSDVTVTSPAVGQVLTYNGTKWVNQTPASGGSTGGGTPAAGGATVYKVEITFAAKTGTPSVSVIGSISAPDGWTSNFAADTSVFTLVKNVAGDVKDVALWGLQSSGTYVGRNRFYVYGTGGMFVVSDAGGNNIDVTIGQASTVGAATVGGKATLYFTI